MGKIFSLTFGVLFVLFAYWQFNDLPQYGTGFWQAWVILYLGIAALSFQGACGRSDRVTLVVIAIALFVAALARGTAIAWEEGVFFNEANPAGNEAGGLLVSAVWVAVLAILSRAERGSVKHSHSHSQS